MKQPQEYVDSLALSQSDIKLFNKSPLAFFKKVELREGVDNISTSSMEAGDIADVLLTDPKAIDHYITDGVGASPAIKEIVDLAIQKIDKAKVTDEHRHEIFFTEDHYLDYLVMAANEKQYKTNYGVDAMRADMKKNAARYFQLKAQNRDKTICSPDIYRAAKNCVERIENDPYTGPLVKGLNSFRKINQGIFYGTYSNTQQKILLDLGLVNDRDKQVWPFDVKTARDIPQFMTNYRQFGYGYQGSYYSDVLQQNFPDYKIMPFGFIVGSISTEDAPLIYRMTADELKLYAEGGYSRGSQLVYGWHQSIKDIEWHRQTNNWAYPRAYYDRKELVIDSTNIYTPANEDLF